MVLTGADGQLRFNAKTVGKVRDWSLSVNRDALEDTCLGVYDRTYVEGLRGTTGSATVLYDPSNQSATDLLNSVFTNGRGGDTVDFVLSTTDDRKITCEALVTSVSPSVSVGAVQAVSVSFQVSGKPIGGF